MTTIKVKLRPPSVKDHPGSVIYLVTKDRVSRLITTPYKVFLHEWDDKTAMVFSSSDARLQTIADGIVYDVERLERIIHTFNVQRRTYSAADVVSEYRRMSEGSTFFNFMEGAILRLKQLNRITTAANYQTTLGRLKKFRNSEDIPFEAFNTILMEDYEAYLKQQGLTPNTISFYMKILRAVYNRAVEHGFVEDAHPFRTVFTGMEKTRKRAISLADVKRIRNLDLKSYPERAFARDVFMFLFFCRGMSFVDAAYLRKTDVRDGVISYRRRKTNQALHIRMEREMQEIVDRYSPRSSSYLLPLLNDNGNARTQYLTAIHRINKSLKKIGKMLNLPIPLTTYVSRHTWATIAKRKNIPLSVISEALGHDSETTTKIYLASIDSSVIDHANNMIIKGL